MHFDFSLIFQALKTLRNAKNTFLDDFYVKEEEEMLFSNM